MNGGGYLPFLPAEIISYISSVQKSTKNFQELKIQRIQQYPHSSCSKFKG
jgi:hypothetical protein